MRRRSECSKQVFKNKKTAEKSADALSKIYASPMAAYKCEKCKGWHIGNAFPYYFNEWNRLTEKKRGKRKPKRANNSPPVSGTPSPTSEGGDNLDGQIKDGGPLQA